MLLGEDPDKDLLRGLCNSHLHFTSFNEPEVQLKPMLIIGHCLQGTSLNKVHVIRSFVRQISTVKVVLL